MHDKKIKFLVITGASGGHIYPALAFIDTLINKYNNSEVLLVLPRRNIENKIESIKFKVSYLPISSIKFRLNLESLSAGLNFFAGALKSIYLLAVFRPGIVVAFGSIVCVPLFISAKMCGIKTLIHEQNVLPGRANRFLAVFANRIAVSFGETKDYFQKYKNKIILTGNPLRKELTRIEKKDALGFFGFCSGKTTILVMGGSLGSTRINQVFLKSLSRLGYKDKFQIIHLAGEKDLTLLKKSYEILNIDVKLFSFLKGMQHAYSASDLAISRAGATTIAELIFFQLPAIIIPYPFAYEHQMANAKILEKVGSSIIIQDSKLNAVTLSNVLGSILDDSRRLQTLRSNYNNIPRIDSNNLIVDEVLNLVL